MKLTIDYAHHPAFKPFSDLSRRSLSDAGVYFTKLNCLWEQLIGPEYAERAADIPARFVAERSRFMAELYPHLSTLGEPDYINFVRQALDKSAEMILREITYRTAARLKVRNYGEKAEDVRDELQTKSVASFHLEPSERAKIVRILEPYIKKLRHDSRTNSGARCFVAVPAWGDDWILIKRFLRRNHIEEGISAFAGYPMELVGYALTYSHPEESWFKQCYQDLELKVPKTVQMHFDEDNISAKSMLYLNDVWKENGAFSFVPRSAAIIASRSQTSYFKCLDYAHAAFAASRGATETSYNRALFGTPALRPHFARLPAELQGSSGPGDDIEDGTPLSDFLTSNEQKITTSVGDFALFAGGETLHRGGVVESGERWALQMIYKDPPPDREKVMQRARALLRPVRDLLRTKAH